MSDNVRKIGDWAFSNCRSLEKIELSASLTEIGVGAFYDCRSLSVIRIPESVCRIARRAFYRCEKLTIHAPAGSYAEQYAKENRIPYRKAPVTVA